VKTGRPASSGEISKLAAASFETIFRRGALMVTGAFSWGECRRMFTEKAAAARASGWAFLSGKGGAAVIAPYLKRASANAKRLRKK